MIELSITSNRIIAQGQPPPSAPPCDAMGSKQCYSYNLDQRKLKKKKRQVKSTILKDFFFNLRERAQVGVGPEGEREAESLLSRKAEVGFRAPSQDPEFIT